MAEVAAAWVSLVPSARGFGKKLDSEISGDVAASGKKAGSGWGKTFALGAAAALGGAAFKFVGDAISEASNAQQSLGATESIFKDFADTVIASSKGASQQFGLSANEYRESANLIGSLFKNQGVAMDQLAGKTDTMIGRAADLSATFGGTTKDAVESLSSAFKGEFNPLEKYGITLNQTAINAELAARGQDKLKGSALAAAKQQATMDLIMRQSKDSMGTFAAESNTLAGQQQRLTKQWADMKATVGTQLLPVLTSFAGFVNSTLLPGLSRFGSFIRDNATALTALGSVLTAGALLVKAYTLSLAIGAAGGMVAWLRGTKLIAAATKTWTAVQWALNVAMRANPIGLVITLLVALGAGLTVAWKKSEKFRNIVSGAFSGVVGAAKSFGASIVSLVQGAFNKVQAAAAAVKNWLGANWKMIAVILSGPWAPAVALILANLDKIIAAGRKVLDWFRGLPGDIKGSLSGAATALYGVGQDLLNGMMSGIKSMAGSLANAAKDAVKGAVDGAKNLLRINSPSKLTRDEIGKPFGEGIADGVRRKAKAVLVSVQTALQQAISGANPLLKKAEKWGEQLGDAIGVKGLAKGLKKAGKELRKQVRQIGRDLGKSLERAVSLRDEYDTIRSGVADAFKGDWFSAVGQEAEFDADGLLIKPATSAVQEFMSSILGNNSMLQSVLGAFQSLKAIPGISKDFLLDLLNSGNNELVLGFAGDPALAAEASRLFTSTTDLANQLGTAVADDRLGDGIYAVRDEVAGMRADLNGLDRRIANALNGASAQAQRNKKAKATSGKGRR